MKRLGKFSLVLLLQLIFAASMLASNANASKGSKGSNDKGSTSVSCSEKGSKGSSDKGSKGSSDKRSKNKGSKDKKRNKKKGSKDKGSKGSSDKGSKGSSDKDCEPQPPVCDDGSDKGSKGSSDKGSKGSKDKKGGEHKKGSKSKGSKGSSDKGSKGSSDKGSKGSNDKGSKGSSDGGGECNPSVERDFGDAPGYGDASHVITANGPYIGSVAPDGELGTPVPVDGTDDTIGVDDEGDYVDSARSDLLVCGGAFVVADSWSISIPVAGNAYLSGWIDWDGNGIFDDQSENFIRDYPPTAGIVENGIASPLPAGLMGQEVYSTYMRIRYSSQMGLTPTGEAPDGEVEDCMIQIER